MGAIICVNGLEVEVQRKRIKHLYLRVDSPGGCIRVTCPQGFPEKAIRDFVLSRMDWIRARLRKPEGPEPVWPPLAQHIWGEQIPVLIDSSASAYAIRLAQGALEVAAPAPLEPVVWQHLLSALFRKLAEEAAGAKISEWSSRLGLGSVSFGVRRMKSRWGTCYPARRRIILNSRIAAHPPCCLEEVIVHELLHFFEPNHSPRFYALMDKHLPDWRRRAKLLEGSYSR